MRRPSRSNYRDIKQRLKDRRHASPPSISDDLGRVLDDLNAWGYLEEQAQTDHSAITCFGPGIFRGYLPFRWTGVAFWYKKRGYYYYDRLYLLGLWAQRDESGGIRVILGRRELLYDLPFFNPESYYRRLQDEFQTYYKDNGAPPSGDQALYSVCYAPENRLEIRRAIEDELRLWALDLKRLW